jgi:hypothetical protein
MKSKRRKRNEEAKEVREFWALLPHDSDGKRKITALLVLQNK